MSDTPTDAPTPEPTPPADEPSLAPTPEPTPPDPAVLSARDGLAHSLLERLGIPVTGNYRARIAEWLEEHGL
jgi:hypothetical protein